MPRRSFLDLLAPLLFAAGLLAVAFGGGFFVGTHRLFPHDQLASATDALYGAYKAYLRPPPFNRPAAAEAVDGSRALDPPKVAPGLTFVVGNGRNGFGAWLIDQDGTVRHRWQRSYSEVFPTAPQLLWQARDSTIAWHGSHLYPDGSILFNFQDNNFPYGSGLAKLDKDSRVVWKLERNTHHDVSVDDDGNIWVPAQHYRPDGIPGFGNLKPWYYEDTVLKVSPDGKVLDEISVLEALRDWPGLSSVTYNEDVKVRLESNDPTHLNNVEPLPRAMAAAFPQFAPGDLLLSLRNMNTLVVLDPRTRKIVWAMHGQFVQQHDPDFLPNGHIMLFDNLGGVNGDASCGRSRVLELDPATTQVVWRYDGCGGTPFDSERRGTVELLPNGNVLIAESLRGRVLEVTHDAQPRIVWEYFNIAGEIDGKPAVGVITHAERFRPDELPFLQEPVS
jgi:hypothetical protein